MKKALNFGWLFGLCIIFTVVTQALSYLTSDSIVSRSLVLTSAYFESEGIVLRWAPSSPGSWRTANYYGYKIERSAYGESGTDTKWEVLETALKPIDLEKWKLWVKDHPTDTFLMVAGQAVHGQISEEKLTPENLMQKTDQLTNLHSACLLSCEFSKAAGLASALRYEDKTATRGARYLYRVTCEADPSLMAVTASVAEEEVYPKIENIGINEGEKVIELKWNRDYYKNYYSGFYIYRSADEGRNWQKITGHPVARQSFKDEHSYIYKDSLDQNYQPYLYRIEGLTSFATSGPMSDPVKAMGKDRTAPLAPYDVKLEYLGQARMKISWKTSELDKDIKGFRISKSNEKQQEFVEITPSMLPGTSRSFIDSSCNENINNYYWIAVFDHEDNVNVTMPQYGTIIDSIAPMPPTGLEGSINTNGVVTLKWKLGAEPDLRGYFVHYANNARHTFINRTDQPLRDTFWRDTIPLNVLTEQIHYKVVAIDHRFNYSGYSEMLTLSKPDKVPPTSPVFLRSFADEKGIQLQWTNSGSHDVKANVLMRRGQGQTQFEEIYRCGPKPSVVNYSDSKITPGKEYEYKLYALDDAGLTSKQISTLTLKAFEEKKLTPPSKITVQHDTIKRTVTLRWLPTEKGVKTVIYRSVNGQPYVSHRVVEQKDFFTDLPYRKGDVLKYRIKLVNSNGWQSDFSEEVEVSTMTRK